MATIEQDGAPWLTIDCGSEGLTTCMAQYGQPPDAWFITHVHLDHVGGLERLFIANYFNPERRGRTRLYVPASIVPLLQQRIASYPNILAEGGANFWDAFQLIPVADAFWHEGIRLEVFEARHHWPRTAWGLRLPGSLMWTGDTRPIPEVLRQYANTGELIAHDCGLTGNPSHSGIEDLEREYPSEWLSRCILYHYASAADGAALQARGYHVAHPQQCLPLATPVLPDLEHA